MGTLVLEVQVTGSNDTHQNFCSPPLWLLCLHTHTPDHCPLMPNSLPSNTPTESNTPMLSKRPTERVSLPLTGPRATNTRENAPTENTAGRWESTNLLI